MVLLLKTIIILLSLAVVAVCKAYADILEEKGDKDYTWHSKYDYKTPVLKNHWWYFGLYTPTFNERFPFSSTLLVSLTDNWHMVNYIRHLCMMIAVSTFTPRPLVFLLVGWAIHSVVFHFTYTNMKGK